MVCRSVKYFQIDDEKKKPGTLTEFSGSTLGNNCVSGNHARIERGAGGPDPPPPLKNHTNIGFRGILANTGPDPLKNHKAFKPAFIVEIIGTPVKCHFNGVSPAG